jgi:hypothetical protein
MGVEETVTPCFRGTGLKTLLYQVRCTLGPFPKVFPKERSDFKLFGVYYCQ